MSSDTGIYIKTEMDDCQEIKIENIEQFIKVEVDENVAFLSFCHFITALSINN